MRKLILLFCALMAVSAEAAQVKVVTYNVWGVPRPASKDASRWSEIPRELDKLDADVVLLQELLTPISRRAARVSTYPYSVRGPRFWGRVGSSGLQILSRWPIIRAESRRFSACAGIDCVANKGALIATIRGPGGAAFDVLDTHLNAGGPESVKRSQIDTIQATIAAYGSPNPLIVGGDFNIVAEPRAPLFRYLMSAVPSIDSFQAWADSPEGQGYPDEVRAGYTSDGATNSWKIGRKDPSRSRIDLLLLARKASLARARPVRSRVLLNDESRGRHLSDHYAVESTFEIDP